MILVLAAGLLQVQQIVFENAYVRVAHNTAFCASHRVPGCRDRVIIALDTLEVQSGRAVRVLARGDIAVFGPGESYPSLAGGPFFEVVIKPDHPSVDSAIEVIPPDKNTMLHDGDRFFVFEERLAVGDTRARHSHGPRVVIQLNRTRLQQWPDGAPEVLRDIEPDRVQFNPPVMHTVKTVGDLPLRGIVIEFRPKAPTPPDSLPHPQPDVSGPIMGGLVGAVAGVAVGGVMGGRLVDDCEEGLWCVALFAFGVGVGAALGEPWGAACGVHIGNGRQGNPLPAILASMVVAAGGVGAAFAADDWKVLLAVPVVQLAVTVPIERATARGTVRRSNWCKVPNW